MLELSEILNKDQELISSVCYQQSAILLADSSAMSSGKAGNSQMSLILWLLLPLRENGSLYGLENLCKFESVYKEDL